MINLLSQLIRRPMSTASTGSGSGGINKGSSSSVASTKTASPASSSSFAGRKLKQTEIDFMKIIEQKNLDRVTKLKNLRRRNNLTGVFIGVTVFGIYMYSMLAVKQETFLDDFNEPQKIATE